MRKQYNLPWKSVPVSVALLETVWGDLFDEVTAEAMGGTPRIEKLRDDDLVELDIVGTGFRIQFVPLPGEKQVAILRSVRGVPGSGSCGWPEDWPSPRLVEHLFDRAVEAMKLEVERPDVQDDESDRKERRKGGRPRDADNDWAWEEIKRDRRKSEVYREWLQRIPKDRRDALADPWDSFRQAMRYRRKQENT